MRWSRKFAVSRPRTFHFHRACRKVFQSFHLGKILCHIGCSWFGCSRHPPCICRAGKLYRRAVTVNLVFSQRNKSCRKTTPRCLGSNRPGSVGMAEWSCTDTFLKDTHRNFYFEEKFGRNLMDIRCSSLCQHQLERNQWGSYCTRR